MRTTTRLSGLRAAASVLALAGAIASASPATAETASPGVTRDTVTWGVTGCMAHPAWGGNCREFLAGMQAAAAEVNDAGGLHGRKLELEVLDDNYEPKRAAENVRRFAEGERVMGVVGLMGGGMAAAAIPVLERHRMPAIGGTTGTDEARQFSSYMFHVRASYRTEVAKIVSHLATLGRTRVAIVHQDNPFGVNVAQTAVALLASKGIAPVLVQKVGATTFNARQMVADIAAATPHVIVAVISPGQLADYLNEAQRASVKPSVYALSLMNHKQLADKLGPMASGITLTQVMPPYWNNAVPAARAYRAALSRHAPVVQPSYLSWEGFISARVLIEALRRAGPRPDRNKLIAALHSPAGIDVGGYRVTYSPRDHEGSRYVEMTLVNASGNLIR